MHAQGEKSKENKSQSVSEGRSKMQRGGQSTFQFEDNRPEAVAQRKLQEMVNNSPRVSPLKSFQKIANNGPSQLQKLANSGVQSETASAEEERDTSEIIQDGKVLQGIFLHSYTTGLVTDSGRTSQEIAEFYEQRGWDLERVWTYDGIEVYTDARNTAEAMNSIALGAAYTPVMIDASMNMDGSFQLLVSPEHYNELQEMGYFQQRGLQRFQMYQQYMEEQGEQVPRAEKEDSIPIISSDDYEVIKILDSGSTKPQHVKFKKTQLEKVIKFGKDQGHLLTEVLSNKLYEKAGIPTLKIELVEIDGQLAQMTDFVEEVKTPDEEDLVSSEDFLRHIGADMLFANWDLFKTDNWMQLEGRMIRADNGGALDRSAQGHMKDEGDWNGEEVKDITSMRAKKNSPYRHTTDHEVADSIRTLSKVLTPEKIEEAFKESHYPAMLRKKMRKTLLERMEIALEWANKIYPIDTLITVDHSWDTGEELSLAEEDDEPIDPAKELTRLGFTGVPENAPASLINEMLRSGFIQPPEPSGKTGNPHESIPMVGPEELTKEDQFGKGLAKEMPKFFSRMVTGRFVRRMSDGERASFEKAAVSKDILEILNLIFPASGKPGARGEMVWSVNKPFIFEREIAKMKGEEYTGDEEAHDPNAYHWVMEIFITDEMLKFFQDYAYVNNPTGKGKPSAFMGNPTLKMEGQSGGKGGEEGIPNVVLKKDGFAKFWRGVESFQFVEAEDHLWKNASDNEELLKAREERKIAERIKIAKYRKKIEALIEKSKLEEEDTLPSLTDLFSKAPEVVEEEEETAYRIILEEFKTNYPEQREGIEAEGHRGLLHQGNNDAPLSSNASHVELRKKHVAEVAKKRRQQNANLNQWFTNNNIAVAHNKGSGLNCLIISLLMHASGRYEDDHDDLAVHYRKLIVNRFVDVNPGEMLYSDNLAYAWLVAEINRDFGGSLDVQFVQSDELGQPYLVPAVRTGHSKVVIVDYGGHYEAIYKTE